MLIIANSGLEECCCCAKFVFVLDEMVTIAAQ